MAEPHPAAPAAKRRKGGSDFLLDAANEQPLAPLVAQQRSALSPQGKPMLQELLEFLTQVRRGITGALTQEEQQRIASKQATLEVEARLGVITYRGGVCRAMPTVPGSGAISLDAQEFKGMDVEFVGGVSAPAFADIKAGAPYLYSAQAPDPLGASPPPKAPEKLSYDTVYTYEGGTRIVVPERQGVPVPPAGWRRETKEQKITMNFQLVAAPYDMRVMVSVEDVQSAAELAEAHSNGDAAVAAAPPQQQPPRDWETQRKRRRVTWETPSGCPAERSHCWRLDATTVEVKEKTESAHAGAAAAAAAGALALSETLEVELELLPNVQAQWLGEVDEGKQQSMTQYLALDLAALIEALNPSAPLSAIADPPKEKRHEVAAAARSLCENLRREGRGGGGSSSSSSHHHGSDGFPGAMPVNMCRRHIGEVQRGDYFISEKTDGVRYLLVAVPDSSSSSGAACVLVDRKMNCYEVEGGALLGGVLRAGTVLDGELVHNRDRGAVFMVFDMLKLGPSSLLGNKFSQRFQAVANYITAPYKAALAPGGALHSPAAAGQQQQQQHSHLPLVQKRFHMRHQIAELLKCVTEAPGAGRERVYKDKDGRHHKTDGVIFQPDAPYCVGTHAALLKWKWLDLASVDLRVGLREGVLEITTEASNAVPVDMTAVVKLAEQDRMRLLADLKQAKAASGGAGRTTAIAEVALDEHSGLWVYMGLRPDKDKPNFITTVMSTLVELAEGISEEELQYRMSVADPAEDEWSKHLGKMQKQLVGWQMDAQRKKAAAAAAAVGRR